MNDSVRYRKGESVTEFSQLIHEGFTTLHRGKDVGWEQASRDTLDLMLPDAKSGEEVVSRAELLDKTACLIGQIVAKPFEPVIFYRPGRHQAVSDENIHIFDVITPDPEKPVEFMAPKDETERDAVIRLNPFCKDIGEIAKHTVQAGFITSVDARPESNVKVWFGIGNQGVDVSPDHAYRNSHLGTQVAAGSHEVSELLTSLRTDDTVRNGRLFGALFNIAWMAHDLGTKPAQLGGFESERAAAIESVHVKRSGAKSLIESSSVIFSLLQDASLEAASQAEIIQSTRTMHRRSIGEVYFQDLYPNREAADEVTNPRVLSSNSLQRHVEQQKASMQRVRDAIESYDKQLRILSSIVN